jgi:hypothetical protein
MKSCKIPKKEMKNRKIVENGMKKCTISWEAQMLLWMHEMFGWNWNFPHVESGREIKIHTNFF